MTVKEIQQNLRFRKISVRELTDGYLRVIEQKNPELGAFLHVNADLGAAVETAQRMIDEDRAALLTGIPVGLKDNLCTTDMPTTCASRFLENYTPPYDATVVSRLRKSGAILIGKLNMDEFAMGASTKTSYFGAAKNPVDTNRVPGGSSGGSAVAVAADMCPVALGSDTGGSVRQPAAFCGITGLRPTYGRVPRYGCVAFASSLDQVGPMGRTPEDCAAVLDTISGKCGFDQTSAESAPVGTLNTDVKNLKIGVISDYDAKSLAPDIAAAVRKCAQTLSDLGAVVEEVSIPLITRAVPAYYLISSSEAAANLARFDGMRYGRRAAGGNYEEIVSASRAEGFGQEVKRRILLGNYALSSGYYDAYYLRAVRFRQALKAQYAKAFETYDALLSPVAPMTAFRFDGVPDDPAAMYMADICTVPAPLAGLPAVSFPFGVDGDNLPIGLMLTGTYFADGKILGIAQRLAVQE